MTRESPLSRRTMLKVTGAATAATLVAGCNGNGDDDNGEEELNREDWEDVDSFEFDGYTGGWEGLEPDQISGETNPTIGLIEGQDYEMTWTNQDGSGHNIAIWDEDRNVVDDSATDVMNDEGESQTLEFTATTDMALYVCEPHDTSMIGDIVVFEE